MLVVISCILVFLLHPTFGESGLLRWKLEYRGNNTHEPLAVPSSRRKLVIRDSKVDDSGNYTCIVSDGQNVLIHHYVVKVVHRVVAHRPIVKDSLPGNHTVLLGSNLTLSCDVEYDNILSSMTMAWVKHLYINGSYKNQQDGSANLRLLQNCTLADTFCDFLLSNPNTTTARKLHLTNLQFNDTGPYSCIATDKYGFDVSTGMITVVEELPEHQSILFTFILIVTCALFWRAESARRKKKNTISVFGYTKQIKVNHINTTSPENSIAPDVTLKKIRSQPKVDSTTGVPFTSEYEFDVDEAWELPIEQLTLGGILGEGNFGKVFKANMNNSKSGTCHEVAVKMLKEGHTDSDVIDLVKEVEIMKKVGSHENVLSLVGVCTKPNGSHPLWAVVEYALHGCLKKTHLQKRKNERNELFVEKETSAWQEMLTERNIIVREAVVNLPIKWMAPEAFFQNFYSTQSDVWSYGILLWEIANYGEQPYREIFDHITLFKKLDEGYRLSKPSDCPQIFYDLMKYCWKYHPEERPNWENLITLTDSLLAGTLDYRYLTLSSENGDDVTTPILMGGERYANCIPSILTCDIKTSSRPPSYVSGYCDIELYTQNRIHPFKTGYSNNVYGKLLNDSCSSISSISSSAASSSNEEHPDEEPSKKITDINNLYKMNGNSTEDDWIEDATAGMEPPQILHPANDITTEEIVSEDNTPTTVIKTSKMVRVKEMNKEEKEETIQLIKGISTFSEKLENILLRLIRDQEDLMEKILMEGKARETDIGNLESSLNDKTGNLENNLSLLNDKLDNDKNDIASQLEKLSNELKEEDCKLKEGLDNQIGDLQKQLQDNKNEMAENQSVLINKLDSINGDLENAVDQLNDKLIDGINELKDSVEDKNNTLNNIIQEEKSDRQLMDEELNKKLEDLQKNFEESSQGSKQQLDELEAAIDKKIDTEVSGIKSDISILGSKLDFGLTGVDKKIEELDAKVDQAMAEVRDNLDAKANELKMSLDEEKLLRAQDIEIAKNNLTEKMKQERSEMDGKQEEVIKMIEDERDELANLGKRIDNEKRDRVRCMSELQYKIEDDLGQTENKLTTDIESLKGELAKEVLLNESENKKIHSDMDELHDLLRNELKETNQNLKSQLEEEEANRIKNDEEIRASLNECTNRLDGSDSVRDSAFQAIKDDLISTNKALEDNLNAELDSLKGIVQSGHDTLKDDLESLKNDINSNINDILKDVENEKSEREKGGQELNKAIEEKVNSCINDIKSLDKNLEEMTSKLEGELSGAVEGLTSDIDGVKSLISKEAETRVKGMEELESDLNAKHSGLESDLNNLKNHIETNKLETAEFVDSAMSKVTDNLSSIDSLLRNDLENLNNLVKEVKAETLDTMKEKVADSIKCLDDKLTTKIDSDLLNLDGALNKEIDKINSDLDLLKNCSQNDNSNLSSQLSSLKADIDGQKQVILGQMSAMDDEILKKVDEVRTELSGEMSNMENDLDNKIASVQSSLHNDSTGAIAKLSEELDSREEALKGLINGKIDGDRNMLETEISALRQEHELSKDTLSTDIKKVNDDILHKLSDLDQKINDETMGLKDEQKALSSDLILKFTDDYDTLNKALVKECIKVQTLEDEMQSKLSDDMSTADKLRLEIQGMKEVIYDNKVKGTAEFDTLKDMMKKDKCDLENRFINDSQNLNQKVEDDCNKLVELHDSLEKEKNRLEKELSNLNAELSKKLKDGSKELEDLIESGNKNINDRLEIERQLLEDQFRQKNKDLANWMKEERERSDNLNSSLNNQLNDEKNKQAQLDLENQKLLEGLNNLKLDIEFRQNEINSLRDELGREKSELLKSNLKLSDLLNNETKLRQEQMNLQEEKAQEVSNLLQRQSKDDDIRYKTIKEDLFKLRQEITRPLSICFNASRSIPYTKGGEEYLTFSGCSLNYGNAFDPTSGVFTAPISGIYLVALHVCTHDLKKVLISIRRNGTELATLYDQNHVDNHKNSMAGQSILTELLVGDKLQAYLYTFTGLHDKEGNHLTQFMGVLMKPLENLVVTHESSKSEPVYAVPDNRRRVIMSQEPA
ncbi:FGFR1 [Lepeophtheirus salmonis]|uniref:receptor protein-tyrosine kinase n=1 Tax=Lepeophtheirus salmonis TaxID=72036 RepID=A0A7R8CWS4_LEPSM|nr:FGFR1 [Lepeophtheirus salmonis]CAF2955135.1 FGFR1 [Lepeophtheirus salmonis]